MVLQCKVQLIMTNKEKQKSEYNIKEKAKQFLQKL